LVSAGVTFNFVREGTTWGTQILDVELDPEYMVIPAADVA
jgi:hypothetical protein